MTELIERVRQADTKTILQAVKDLQADFVGTTEQRMLRAALIEVYAEREGVEAANNLMDTLGM